MTLWFEHLQRTPKLRILLFSLSICKGSSSCPRVSLRRANQTQKEKEFVEEETFEILVLGKPNQIWLKHVRHIFLKFWCFFYFFFFWVLRQKCWIFGFTEESNLQEANYSWKVVRKTLKVYQNWKRKGNKRSIYPSNVITWRTCGSLTVVTKMGLIAVFRQQLPKLKCWGQLTKAL